MADEKVVTAEVTETTEKTVKAPKAKTTKKVAKEEKKAEVKAKAFAKPTAHDYSVIIAPLITEKSMALIQNENKVTVKVASTANKVEIKESFQRCFQVGVTDVKVVNQIAKAKTRGGRYQGSISGFKKAVITLAEGAALDLFKE